MFRGRNFSTNCHIGMDEIALVMAAYPTSFQRTRTTNLGTFHMIQERQSNMAARLPFDPREARELGEVLVPAVLHDEVAEEGMVAAELRRAGTCARRCNGEERSGRRAEQIYSPPPVRR